MQVLDLGARPRAFFGKQQLVYLAESVDTVVEQADLDPILAKLEGKFGGDNRRAHQRLGRHVNKT